MGVPTELNSGERDRDRRARALFEGIDDAVFVHDLDGHILDANPAACRRLGYTRNELLRLRTADIDNPTFAAGFGDRLQEQLAAGRLTVEGRHVTKDGRIIPVEVNTSAIQIDGKPAILAVIRDISAHKQIEKALRESEAFYHSLVESLPQHILRKDRDGQFTFVNQRVCDMLHRPLEDIVGKTDFDLFPAELAEKYRADDLYVMESGTNLETVEEHRTPDGQTHYVQIIKTPIYDSREKLIGTQVIFWDVTDRHRWEVALGESERRYRQLTEAYAGRHRRRRPTRAGHAVQPGGRADVRLRRRRGAGPTPGSADPGRISARPTGAASERYLATRERQHDRPVDRAARPPQGRHGVPMELSLERHRRGRRGAVPRRHPRHDRA